VACGLIPTTTARDGNHSHLSELKGRPENGHAVRVPLANASLTDCVFEVGDPPTSVTAVNELLRAAAEQGPLKGASSAMRRPLSLDCLTKTRSPLQHHRRSLHDGGSTRPK